MRKLKTKNIRSSNQQEHKKIKQTKNSNNEKTWKIGSWNVRSLKKKELDKKFDKGN